jgi:GH15 family glucan-1,4-alpha-glucosidase
MGQRAPRIEDYALIGDMDCAALVARDGGIDWWCAPRFDSNAAFSALLGGDAHGTYRIGPRAPIARARRRYLDDALVLETELETDGGAVRITDCMPPRRRDPTIVRLVEGLRGEVPVELTLAPRFEYGRLIPWVSGEGKVHRLIAGPDALLFVAETAVERDQGALRSRFTARAGTAAGFVLTWYPSHEDPPASVDAREAIARTVAHWRSWVGRCAYDGPWREAVTRSLITLKALTYEPTGGLVAAATTSLPEWPGGVRNWDYRYCWLRDATFTLYALMSSGYVAEAAAWRDWLLRAIAGDPRQMQILYGVGGERRITEQVIDWLPGFAGARPVRVGNAAEQQLQLDVYGEIMDCLHQARRAGIPPSEEAWLMQRALIEHLERCWREPDEGIWEVRSGRHQLTWSKVQVWVAFDRAVRAVERRGFEGPVERWRALRDEVHAEVCRRGFNRERDTFTMTYDGTEPDAALLLIPQVGFLPPSDPRVVGTVAAVERALIRDGFVSRYDTRTISDGLPPGEGTFIACSFWLVDALSMLGRVAEAHRLFERLLAIRNDVGLLSEEYDPRSRRLLGNFPQAYSHVALIDSAHQLSRRPGPADERGGGD